MEKINDGGPSFPGAMGYDFKGNRVVTASEGMSLRDYFAAAAITGLVQVFVPGKEQFSDLVRAAYKVADGMLTARQEPPR